MEATTILNKQGSHGVLITPQSQVRILSPQLVLTVAKSGYRRVIRKAGVQRRRPFCVLSPVLATTSSVARWSLFGDLGQSRATLRRAVASPCGPDFGQNSRLSLCLAPPGLTAVASAPTAHNPLGLGAMSGARTKRTQRFIFRRRALNGRWSRYAASPGSTRSGARSGGRLGWHATLSLFRGVHAFC